MPVAVTGFHPYSRCELHFGARSYVRVFGVVHEVCMDGATSELLAANMPCSQRDRSALPVFEMVVLVLDSVSSDNLYHWS
jgi:hypothetical protein